MKVIIVGGGQTGAYIAKRLIANDKDVIIVENREKVLKSLSLMFDKHHYIAGSGTEPNLLESINIHDADVIVAATGNDETNLVVATLAKFEYGVKRVIARINNPRNAWLFEGRMGVDAVVNQADLLSKIVSDEVDMSKFEILLNINRGKHSIVQVGVEASSKVVGKTIADLNLPAESILISVLRNEEMEVVNGNTEVQAGDVFLAFTNDSGKRSLTKLFKN